MPKAQMETKIKQLILQYRYDHNDSPSVIRNIIDGLSAFYSISKQAAKIRMIELGYPEAAEVYNYDAECFYTSREITKRTRREMCANNEFKTLIDMELFR